MSHVIRQPRIFLALIGSLAVLCLGLIGTSPAKASWSNYCNPITLAGNTGCSGSARYMHQVYGWGDQHSVCVGSMSMSSTWRCSSGPGAGVYSTTFGPLTWYPGIQNNAAGTNTVHGISFTP